MDAVIQFEEVCPLLDQQLSIADNSGIHAGGTTLFRLGSVRNGLLLFVMNLDYCKFSPRNKRIKPKQYDNLSKVCYNNHKQIF